MRKFTFAAVAVVAAGEAIQMGGAMSPRDTCPEASLFCTGPVLLQGTATTLTYVCPKTAEAGSTIHHTVTVTTTVPAPSDTAVVPPKGNSQKSEPITTTDEVPPKDTPHGPELTKTPELTTTTTILSTATQTKTLTLTRKTGSSSTSDSVTSSSKPTHPPLQHSSGFVRPSIPAELPPLSWSSWANVTASSQSSQPSFNPTPWPNITTVLTITTHPLLQHSGIKLTGTGAILLTTVVPAPSLLVWTPTPVSSDVFSPISMSSTQVSSLNATGTGIQTHSIHDPVRSSMLWSDPVPQQSNIAIPTSMPLVLSTQFPILNVTATSTSIWIQPSVSISDPSLMPTVPSSSLPTFSLAPEDPNMIWSPNFPSRTSTGTDEKSAHPVSVIMTSTGGYGAPTLLQVRALSANATTSVHMTAHLNATMSANATTSAKPTKTGGAGQKGASVGALVCGLLAAAYFA